MRVRVAVLADGVRKATVLIGNVAAGVEYGVSCAPAGLTSEAKVLVTYKKQSGGGGLDVLGVALLGLGARRRRAAIGFSLQRRKAR